jgi:hypothetical protein
VSCVSEWVRNEKIWKIQKKSKLNSERSVKYGRKVSWIVKRYEKYGRSSNVASYIRFTEF